PRLRHPRLGHAARRRKLRLREPGPEPVPRVRRSLLQGFLLFIAVGVVSYLLTPFVRDVAIAAGAPGAAHWLDLPAVRVLLPLAVLWSFVGVNLRGLETYQRVLLPLLGLTFLLGAVVIVAGFVLGPEAAPPGREPALAPAGPGTIATAA